jgi:glycosyltransferase involved in cell wall biosynthesis
MPFYNGHEHIAESVKSVLEQSYRNFELIIVNDGSHAPTPEEILREHKYDCSKIRFIDHKQNRGLSAARNTGFENSRGELVLPLDCDDIIAPSFLEETVSVITKDTTIDAVYTMVHILGDLEMNWNPQVTMVNLMCGLPIPSTVLYWKRVFDLVGGYNTSIEYVPDVDFWIRVLSKGGKLYFLDKPLYFYRKHANSLSEVGQLSEVAVLAEANRQLYLDNLIEVLALEEMKYFNLKTEYAKLQSGFRLMESGYEDLLRRYDEVVRQLQKRSIRYNLKKLLRVD